MKQIFTFLLLALIVQVGFAQEEKTEEKDEMNTFFTKDNFKFTGGYIAPELKISNIHEDMGLLFGGKFGFTFNDNLTIGLAGYGLTTKSNFNIQNPVMSSISLIPVRIGMGYGGLSMEYTIFSNKLVHFTIPVVVGAAGIYIYEDDGDFFHDNFDDIENTAAFVVEPGINVELNLFKFFRVDLGASYRLIQCTGLMYLQDEDLSDLSVNATFKFGFF